MGAAARLAVAKSESGVGGVRQALDSAGSAAPARPGECSQRRLLQWGSRRVADSASSRRTGARMAVLLFFRLRRKVGRERNNLIFFFKGGHPPAHHSYVAYFTALHCILATLFSGRSGEDPPVR